MAKGNSEKKPFYKRWWFILLAAIIVIGGIAQATGGDSSDKKEATSSSQSSDKASDSAGEGSDSAKEESDDEIVAGIGDSVTSGELEIVVSSVGDPVTTIGDEYVNDTAQGEYIPVEVSVTNNGTDSEYVGDSDINLVAGESTYSSDSGAIMYLDDAFLFEEINPGNTLSGTLVFDVPEGTDIDSVTFSGGIFSKDAVIEVK